MMRTARLARRRRPRPRELRWGVRASLPLAALVVVACGQPIAPGDGRSDATTDAVRDASRTDAALAAPTDELDLLLVYDNSGYTANGGYDDDRELDRALRVLVSGDRDGDGTQDFEPVRSLHVGIINGSQGAGDLVQIRCNASTNSDGVLQVDLPGPSTDVQAICVGPLLEVPAGRVFSYETGGRRSLDDAIADILCETPTLSNRTGCSLQQMLEATLEALSPTALPDGSSPVAWTADDYRPPTFVGGRSAHGDDPATNGWFLRPDSVLAIIVFASHDDYSTPNPRLYGDDPRYASVEPFHRPYVFPEEMYPIDRYVDGLVGLRRSPSRFVYAMTGGIPVGVSGMSPEVILADPLMAPMNRPDMPNWLLDACWDQQGYALPAIRLTQMARGVLEAGGRASAHTECSDQVAAFDRILDDVIAALRGG